MSRSEEEPGFCTISRLATHRRHDVSPVHDTLGVQETWRLPRARWTQWASRREGEPVSFLSSSLHFVGRMEGSKRREDLDSEIYKLTTSVTHLSWCTWRVDNRSGSSTWLSKYWRSAVEGVKVDRLCRCWNSIRERKSWDDIKAGCVDPMWKAREEEVRFVKTHAVYRKSVRSQCWKETENRLDWHEQGNVRVSEHKILMGRDGIQHLTQTQLVQCKELLSYVWDTCPVREITVYTIAGHIWFHESLRPHALWSLIIAVWKILHSSRASKRKLS